MKQNALVEIDSSSLSSKSSTTTHSSFQDLRNAWQQVSSANNSATPTKQLDQRQQNGSNKGIVMKSSRYVFFVLFWRGAFVRQGEKCFFFRGEYNQVEKSKVWRVKKDWSKWTCIFLGGVGFDFGLASFCIIFNCYNMYGEKDLASRECMWGNAGGGGGAVSMWGRLVCGLRYGGLVLCSFFHCCN